jgi:hypothetical protein
MSLTDNQAWMLRHLDSQKPDKAVTALPLREGASREDMEAAVAGLLESKMVWVDGPSNQNSDLGMDIDLMVLLPFGESALSKN